MSKPKYYLGQTVVSLKEIKGIKTHIYCRRGQKIKINAIKYTNNNFFYLCDDEDYKFMEFELCTVEDYYRMRRDGSWEYWNYWKHIV